MNASYFDVATLLNDSGKFGALGTNLFGGEWGKPDKQILVIEGVGTPSDLKELYEQPGIQILVRGEKKIETDHDVYLVAKSIYDFLVSQSDNTLINGEIYKGFEPSTNIAPLGKDENERFIYTANYMTWRDAN